MTTRESTSPPPETLLPSLDPHFDADGAIDQDYYCFACGYNLRTLHAEATCPECGQSVAQTVEQRRRVGGNLLHLGQFSIWSRLCYAALGIVLPAICFATALNESPFRLDMYQDGHWQTYVQLLYGGWSTVAFWPLLLYAMICLGAMLIRPLSAGRYIAVRFGIYNGVVLAFQYLVILCMAMGGGGGAVMALVMLGGIVLFAGILHGLRVWWCRMRGRHPDVSWVLMGSIAFVIAMGLGVLVWPAVVIITLLLAPAWTLLVYGLMAMRILATDFEQTDNSFAWPLLGIGWVAAWGVSWVAAIYFAIEAYAKLPTAPPNCYIATAAARGHRKLVGSHPLPCGNGNVMLVNRQLRLCKVSELALLALCPPLHRLLRAIYDTLGPPLARRLTHPLAADAAYLLIAPIAAVAYLLLRLIGCDVERAMGRVYPTRD